MATQTAPIIDEQVVPWLRGLLSSCKQLEAQTDAYWRHAYGIAQGAGFTLKNRAWPPFPTTSGSSFMSLVNGEKVRRKGNQPPGGGADPFSPQPMPKLDGVSLPEAGASQEKQAEQLIKGLLKQAEILGRADPCWRHAYGIAQGFGALRRTTAWPPFPTEPGSRFLELVEFDQGRRDMAGPGNVPPHLAAPTQLEPPEERRPMPPRAPMGNFNRPPTGRPVPPRAPQPLGGRPQPPRPPGAPGRPDDARRAMPTMLEGNDEDARRAMPTMMEGNDEDARRAMPTMMEAGGGEGDAFRGMPTMLEAGGDGSPASGGGEDDAFRGMPTMLEAGSDDGGLEGDGGGQNEAFRAMPTMMDAADAPPAAAAPPARREPPPLQKGPPARRGPKLGGMRNQLTGEGKKADQRKRASKSEEVEQIGSFKILSKLGKGAMGQVFKGEGPTGEIVAIKVLHQRFGKSKRVKARFMREAKAVERIQHPNVVRFYETGEQAGVGQYIAMEFVDGDPMHDMLKKGRGKPFPLERALEFFAQCCKGMRAAHAAGVIHRDLKPENVLVSRAGEVKITDFSLARRDEDSMLLTRPGQVMGTPHFMSPEQAKGETVDARTDIYSLGAMLYVMLTGAFPFPNGSVSEVIAAHCEEPRPDPRAKNPQVPKQVAELCMRLMSVNRGERPQTMEALLDELNTDYGLDKEDEEEVIVAGSLPPGTKVDEFAVQKVIGAGGMGAVYRAVHPDLGTVGLKLLPPQPGRAPQERVKDVRRFHNEAKLAKRVKSENTYEIKKFGVDANGQAYIAMSLEEGLSLKALITKRGFLSPTLIIHVARGVCQALKGLKEAGVVHRDVTPANIMLTGEFHEAKDANVRLIDFGLAIPLEREKKKNYLEKGGIQLAHIAKKAEESFEDLDEDELFIEDLPGGTPAYMAPEVLEDPSLVDGRADLYGLGATLYHAATGHPPYTGDSIQQVIYQQRNQAPAPITQFNADFPEELSELILGLLAVSPNMRPRSPRLLLSKLSRLEDPKAVQSYRPGGGVVGAPQVEVHEVIVSVFRFQDFALGFVVAVVLIAVSLLILPQVGVKVPEPILQLMGAKPS